jgi:hypothetical protein
MNTDRTTFVYECYLTVFHYLRCIISGHHISISACCFQTTMKLVFFDEFFLNEQLLQSIVNHSVAHQLRSPGRAQRNECGSGPYC